MKIMAIWKCPPIHAVLLCWLCILSDGKMKPKGTHRIPINNPSASKDFHHDEWETGAIYWDDAVRIKADLTATFTKRFKSSTAFLITHLGVLLNKDRKEVASVTTTTSQLKITFHKMQHQQQTTSLTISKTLLHSNCYQVHWRSEEATALRDCFDISNGHWFGLGEMYRQVWPLSKGSFNMSAFTVHDFLSTRPHGKGVFGGVLEPMLISSRGVGVYVHDREQPIAVSLNADGKKQICIQTNTQRKGTSNHKNSNGCNMSNNNNRNNKRVSELKYTVCMAPNIKAVHEMLSNQFIAKPKGHPDLRMITEPVWSTWVLCKKDVNQSAVLDFAQNIRKFHLPASHVEIDDIYSTRYGDFDFDSKKFPKLEKMVGALTSLGFRLTAWVHPFCNTDADCFTEGLPYFMLAEEGGHELVGITKWWDGDAGILDTTNPKARHWFLQRLNNFKKLGLAGFKFDAGEINYLPKNYRFNTPQGNPNTYATRYVEMASASGSLTEVRVGYKSQQFPVFVRALDRDSSWGIDNGLRSVLTSTLTFSILGYPFVLPDMIGGNAYNTVPSKELYVRWAQLSVFLPGLQFSLPPWKYEDPEVMTLIHSALAIRKKLSEYMVQLAVDVQVTGDPIVRPMWWYWPRDEQAVVADQQFMLGDRYLIAPVLHAGVELHRVYLPLGVWREEWGNRRTHRVQGVGMFMEYRVTLNDTPYYELLGRL